MSNQEQVSELRSLQADLNNFAKVAGFEGIVIDGAVGPATLGAVQKVVAAVLAKNPLLVPAMFTYGSKEDVVKYVSPIREWLQTTAAKTLDVTTFRVYQKGEGKDWNVKGDIAYGKGAVHDEFMGVQRELNKLTTVVGFEPLDVDGFIGPKTAAAVKQTYEMLITKNPLFRITLFPPPLTKEETAAFAAYIHDWLKNTASKHLL